MMTEETNAPKDLDSMAPEEYATYFREVMGQRRSDSGSLSLTLTDFTDYAFLTAARMLADAKTLLGIMEAASEHLGQPIVGIWHNTDGSPILRTEDTRSVDGDALPKHLRDHNLHENKLYSALRDRMVESAAAPFLPLETILTTAQGVNQDFMAAWATALDAMNQTNSTTVLSLEDFNAMTYVTLRVIDENPFEMNEDQLNALRHASRGIPYTANSDKEAARNQFEYITAITKTYDR